MLAYEDAKAAADGAAAQRWVPQAGRGGCQAGAECSVCDAMQCDAAVCAGPGGLAVLGRAAVAAGTAWLWEPETNAFIPAPNERRRAEGEEGPGETGEEEEEEQEFSPEKGNVAFASAYDGWAFRTSQFAELYAGGWVRD